MFSNASQRRTPIGIWENIFEKADIEYLFEHGEVINSKSNQTLFVTCDEYNRCRPYSEMLTYKHLTNNAVQEFDLPNKLK
jgi:hypothetical protein